MHAASAASALLHWDMVGTAMVTGLAVGEATLTTWASYCLCSGTCKAQMRAGT
jgi:hypothetical protein